VIARVADHCFWLGRYVERAESTARVLEVTGAIALDAELAPRRSWQPVVVVAGQEADLVARFGEGALGDGDLVQRYLATDRKNPVSIVRSAFAARENARAIREVISLEVWRAVNELALSLAASSDDTTADLDALYAKVRRSTQLALGLVRSTMLQDAPLDFIWLGVLLERVGQTARLLDVQHHALLAEGAPHPVLETALWLSLLRACSGFEAFMKRNRGRVTGPSVASFLVLEKRFPRAVAFCVRAARDRFAALCADGEVTAARALDRLTALDRYLTDLAPGDLEGGHVHAVLTHVVNETHAVCDFIGREVLAGDVASSMSQAQSQ
jgi:uncharacterized alpha-E superfamily protein